jgi:hypothetical protein
MPKRGRLAMVGAFAAVALAWLPRPARALTVTPDPLAIGSPFLGSVDFLGMTTGLPSGGDVLAGGLGAGDVTLVFQVTVDAESTVAWPNGPDLDLSLAATAIGWIPGPDLDVATAEFTLSNTSAHWHSVNSTGEINPGETLDPIFVSFAALDPGETLTWVAAGLVDVGTQTVVVPEPSLALLMLTACAGGVLRARRHGSRSAPRS